MKPSVSMARRRLVVITGASSGLGRCAAALFARKGWNVGLIARGLPGLQAAQDDVRRLGGLAQLEQADVTDVGQLEAAADRIVQNLGPIDAWVNCAGNATLGRFMDTPAEQFQRVTDVTYLGTVNGTRAALARMLPRNQGRIVNICSAVAFQGIPRMASYSGAKHAVRGFDQAIRTELKQEKSRVTLTTMYPPALNTPFFDHAVSHMERPGRPMWPIYAPEPVVDAIYLAATHGQREILVSSTTFLFSLAASIVPRVVIWAIGRIGCKEQVSALAASVSRYDPTLFAASEIASPVHGPFGAQCRNRSFQVRFLHFVPRLHAGWRQVFRRGTISVDR